MSQTIHGAKCRSCGRWFRVYIFKEIETGQCILDPEECPHCKFDYDYDPMPIKGGGHIESD